MVKESRLLEEFLVNSKVTKAGVRQPAMGKKCIRMNAGVKVPMHDTRQRSSTSKQA